MQPEELSTLSLDFEDASLEAEMEQDDQVTEDQAGSAVVYSADWTAETILGQLEKGNIDVKPRFQRRDAWSSSHKSRFIESLILGLPIPQIVLAELGKGRFIVLDGKQRLLALLQ